jgi:hypothetical protein
MKRDRAQKGKGKWSGPARSAACVSALAGRFLGGLAGRPGRGVGACLVADRRLLRGLLLGSLLRSHVFSNGSCAPRLTERCDIVPNGAGFTQCESCARACGNARVCGGRVTQPGNRHGGRSAASGRCSHVGTAARGRSRRRCRGCAPTPGPSLARQPGPAAAPPRSAGRPAARPRAQRFAATDRPPLVSLCIAELVPTDTLPASL